MAQRHPCHRRDVDRAGGFYPPAIDAGGDGRRPAVVGGDEPGRVHRRDGLVAARPEDLFGVAVRLHVGVAGRAGGAGTAIFRRGELHALPPLGVVRLQVEGFPGRVGIPALDRQTLDRVVGHHRFLHPGLVEARGTALRGHGDGEVGVLLGRGSKRDFIVPARPLPHAIEGRATARRGGGDGEAGDQVRIVVAQLDGDRFRLRPGGEQRRHGGSPLGDRGGLIFYFRPAGDSPRLSDGGGQGRAC